MIKQGILASDARRILSDLAVPQDVLSTALNIPVAVMDRKIKSRVRLPPAETERVLGLGRLVVQIRSIVAQSGNPRDFDASAWLSRWLSESLPALGGARPLDLLDTMEGQVLISDTLAQVQSGAYA